MPWLSKVARRDSSGNVNYYLSDHLGSSRVVTDSAGTILDDCDFLPFGQERCYSGSSTNHYKFTGKERDSESGNDYFGARYYPNTLYRWLRPDPIGHMAAKLDDPQTWNLYAYVRNNPTNLTDPTGLEQNQTSGNGGGSHGPDNGCGPNYAGGAYIARFAMCAEKRHRAGGERMQEIDFHAQRQ